MESDKCLGKGVKRQMRKYLRFLLLMVFLVSTALLLRQFLHRSAGEDSYQRALAIAQGSPEKSAVPAPVRESASPSGPVLVPAPVEDDPEMDALALIDLQALREINPDVLGWIRIPGTSIDYPLMQGEDNDFYLNHTWEGEKYVVGSIFLEHRNSPELDDYNTIVYGHSMNDGSMFAGLKSYGEKHWLDGHPYVYVVSDGGVYRYEIFTVYRASLDSPTYGLSFHQPETKANFLAHALEESLYDTGIIPHPDDRILTLSTCTGNSYTERWVVQARMKMMDVSP